MAKQKSSLPAMLRQAALRKAAAQEQEEELTDPVLDAAFLFAGPQTKKLVRQKHLLRKRVFTLALWGMRMKEKHTDLENRRDQLENQLAASHQQTRDSEKRCKETEKSMSDGMNLIRKARDKATADTAEQKELVFRVTFGFLSVDYGALL